MHSHWDTLYACDFFAVEALGVFGAVRHMVVFVVKLDTHEVYIAGSRVNHDGAWMKQIARNLTDPIEGFLRDATYLIHDADPLFTADIKAFLKPASYTDSEGVTCVKIPPKSPNCNPHAERFVKTIKYECLWHFVFFGQRHLRYVITEYMDPYHHERFHQGIGSSFISPNAANDNSANGEVRCRSRLGGLLIFYYREAAQSVSASIWTAHRGECEQRRRPLNNVRAKDPHPEPRLAVVRAPLVAGRTRF